MKNTVIFSLLVALLLSCGGEVKDARVEAYKGAVEKVRLATMSEELVTISYNLYCELAQLEDSLGTIEEIRTQALAGNEDCAELLDSIKQYSELYSELLAEREMQFYIENTPN